MNTKGAGLNEITLDFESSPEDSKWKRKVQVFTLDELRSWRATVPFVCKTLCCYVGRNAEIHSLLVKLGVLAR